MNKLFKERSKERSILTLYRTLVVIASVLVAFIMSSIVLLLIRANVGLTYYTMLIKPFTSKIHITEVLLRAIPLCIIALGVSVAYRSGIINIGAEGQMAMGVICFTGIALLCPNLPKPVLLPLCLLSACLGGAFWGFIPGILKAKLKVSELLSTVMLNYIAAQAYSLCLRTIYMDPTDKATPQSARLARGAWLTRFKGLGRLHTGLIIALVLAVLVYLLMWKTSTGYKLRAAGSGDRAARYGGINVAKYVTIAMVISGLFAGLAGGVEIAGVHRRAIEGITNNYGFAGVVVALFGGLHPFGIIPASYFFGLLIYGATLISGETGVPANIVGVMEGIIILVIVVAQMIINNKYYQDRFERFIENRKNNKMNKTSKNEQSVENRQNVQKTEVAK